MPIDPKVELPKLQTRMQALIPGFKLQEKKTSKVMRFAYYALLMPLWCPKFLNGYWTTLGSTVYAPDLHLLGQTRVVAGKSRGPMDDYATLFHEFRHLRDAATLPGPRAFRGLVWGAGYAFPQVLALGALGAFWSPWAWLCLLALAPWPAPFREWIERRGYGATLEAWQMMGYALPDPTDLWLKKLVTEKFCGWTYYRMSWSRARTTRWFVGHILTLRNERLARAIDVSLAGAKKGS